MFGPRRHRHHGRGGRRGGGNFGLFLLGIQLFKFIQYLSSRDEFIPTTLVAMAINIILFVRPEFRFRRNYIHWPTAQSSCISVQSVWYQQQWDRILLAPFVHGDAWHLYYNMASFMWKARTLERHFGSGYFAYLLAVFSILSSTLYIALNFMVAEGFDSWSYVRNCAVGFSGVIFALKVLTTHLEPSGMTYIFGIPVPKRLAVWGELIVISVLFPNASFVGHLAGILVGLAYVSGPLKQIMDLPIAMVTGGASVMSGRQSYTYTSRTTGTREQTRPVVMTTDEDEDLQHAIARSLRDTNERSDDNYERPPPYNPDYREPDDVEPEPNYENESDVRNSSSSHVENDESWNREGEMRLEELREARLRRLDRNSGTNRSRQPNS